MKDVIKLVVAILIIIVAWKILKGVVGLLVAGLVVYGAMKLIDGNKRIK